MDWAKYYAQRPLDFGRTEYLAQVGHTVGGKPISEAQFRTLVARVVDLLDLQGSDVVLDLGCGNGLITHELAPLVSEVVGVDFSEGMIEIARESHQSSNTSYRIHDVRSMGRIDSLGEKAFTKVLMFGALQHLRERELNQLLAGILRFSAPKPTILLGFVPNRRKRRIFLNTRRRLWTYYLRRLVGNELMGTWWRFEDISRICSDWSLTAEFFDLPENHYGAEYRFHARIS